MNKQQLNKWGNTFNNGAQTLEEKLTDMEQIIMSEDHMRTIRFARELRVALIALDKLKDLGPAQEALDAILGKPNE